MLDGLNIDKAHVVGLSMGGFATLHFGFTYPDRCARSPSGGCGYGAAPDQRQMFAAEAQAAAARFEAGIAAGRGNLCVGADAGCSSRTRTRAAGANSPINSPGIRLPAGR